METDARLLTFAESLALLPPGDRIRVFAEAGTSIVGSDWHRDHVLTLLATSDRREVAGASARAEGHGLAVWRVDGLPVFIATRPGTFAEFPKGTTSGGRA